MHRPQQESIDELKAQIQDLQRRLGELHAGDVNSLKRANHTLAQHTRSLYLEMRDLNRAAARLGRIKDVQSGASEVAKSLGVLWLGSVITYWLKTSLKLGHKVSGVMLLLTAVSAVVPLGVNGCCRLRKVLLDNPKAIDELLRALQVLESRVNIMCELTNQPTTGSVPGTAESFPPLTLRGVTSAITDPAWDEQVLPSPMGSGSDDLVNQYHELVPSDWESPRGHPGITMNRLDTSNPTSLAASQVAAGGQSVHVSEAHDGTAPEPVLSLVGPGDESDHVMLADTK